MSRVVLRLCGVVLVLSLSFASAVSQDLPLPKEWETVYACFFGINLDYVAGTADQESALTMGHMQYQLRLQADGKAVAAGGIGQGQGADMIIGLTIIRAGSLAEAQAIANDDPAVKAGRLQAWVREWRVPSGKLPPPPQPAE